MRAVVRSGAAWFLPVLFALAAWYGARLTVPIGYAAGDLAQAGIGLYVAAPATAAFMALQYRGFTSLTRPLRSVRSGLRLAVRAWWPLLLGAPTALCLAVLVSGRAVPDDGPAWALLAIDFLTVLTAGLTGLACAWAFPAVVAVPLAAVGWFAWIGYGPASASTLVHNLDSTFGCCSSDTRPAAVAVRATLLLLLVTSASIACLLAPARSARIPRPLVAVALVAALAAGFGAGAATLGTSDRPLDLTATEPRTTSLTCRTTYDVEVCLWPENGDRAVALARIVNALGPELRLLGLAPVHRLVQGGPVPDAVSVEAGAGLSSQDLRLGVASGYVDARAGCRSAPSAARDRSVALVALLTGLRPDDVVPRLGSGPVAAAEDALALRERTPPEVARWFRASVAEIGCARTR
ncbi:hypothetical protein ACFJIY_11580 [Pimelobacter simplex]|uniref:DUF7224 domain-containing protein n=1 Tax=Nocardioides simplex TaxID=2045 RepID=UPI00366CBDD4